MRMMMCAEYDVHDDDGGDMRMIVMMVLNELF